MHPSQARVIQYVEEGISLLTANLMHDFGLEECDALDILEKIDGVTDKLQEGKFQEIYETAKKKYAGVVNAAEDPKKELYPGHPHYMAPLTTVDSFNDHMAQAMTPYILAIAKKIAKDRGIENPNENEIKMVLKNIDWASAAYAAEQTPKTPGAIRLFLRKYIFAPISKVTDKVPFDTIFGLAGMGTIMYMIWATFNKQLEDIGKPPVAAYEKYTTYRQNRVNRRLYKKYGLPYGR